MQQSGLLVFFENLHFTVHGKSSRENIENKKEHFMAEIHYCDFRIQTDSKSVDPMAQGNLPLHNYTQAGQTVPRIFTVRHVMQRTVLLPQFCPSVCLSVCQMRVL